MISVCGEDPHRPAALFLFACLGGLLGCASPGAPRPPSLQIPQPVRALSAARSGDGVLIRFPVPSRTTDGLPLRSRTVYATLCRQSGAQAPCQPVDLPEAKMPLPLSADPNAVVRWTDPLPAALRQGPPRPIFYRVEVRSEAGRSAGPSEPVPAAAGAAPPPVQDLTAQGTRPGILLSWQPDPGAGDVLLERTEVDPPPSATAPSGTRGSPTVGSRASSLLLGEPSRTATTEPGVQWLQADPGNTAAARTLDGHATEGVRYRYVAVRRILAQSGGQNGGQPPLELRSAPSGPVEFTWRDIYPPDAPQGLTALGFQASPAGNAGYAVDLIWQPQDDARVSGYLVRRVALNNSGSPESAPELLTPIPLASPSFHDTTALPSRSYRYEVTAVDPKGNVSPAASTVVPASLK